MTQPSPAKVHRLLYQKRKTRPVESWMSFAVWFDCTGPTLRFVLELVAGDPQKGEDAGVQTCVKLLMPVWVPVALPWAYR